MKTKFWKKINSDTILCELCPNRCVIKNGFHGRCFIRKNVNNNLELLAYGKTTGIAVDPIEKKPLYHFLPGSKTLSFGSIGCNLNCKFCQNWHISMSKDLSLLDRKLSPKEIAQLAIKNNCESVAFTYNEPTTSFEYIIDIAIECKKLNIKTISVTNGYILSEPRKELYKHIDAANVDLKAFNDDTYKKIIGGTLQPILETIKYLHNSDTWLEITTLLISGINDSENEIRSECEWIVDNIGVSVPLHFSAFHPAWKMLYIKRTSAETVISACEIAKTYGIKYVYAGNI